MRRVIDLFYFILQPSNFNADVRVDAPPPMSDGEFEDIMTRNRTVSSSAIARAVADASSGNINIFMKK